jgi:hypothetical protein
LDLGDVIGPVEERSAMEWESLVFGNKAEWWHAWRRGWITTCPDCPPTPLMFSYVFRRINQLMCFQACDQLFRHLCFHECGRLIMFICALMWHVIPRSWYIIYVFFVNVVYGLMDMSCAKWSENCVWTERVTWSSNSRADFKEVMAQGNEVLQGHLTKEIKGESGINVIS